MNRRSDDRRVCCARGPFESTSSSRQFFGRSSMTMSRPSEAAMRPRDPCTTKTLGSVKPFDSSQRCVCTYAVAGGFRTLRQENDLPPAIGRDARQPGDDAGLDLGERFLEVFDRLHLAPEPPLLARGHVEPDERGYVAERSLGCSLAIVGHLNRLVRRRSPRFGRRIGARQRVP